MTGKRHEEQANQRVHIGQVAAPQGVQGDVRILSLSDFPERWPRIRSVYIGDEPQPRAVRFVGWTRGGAMPVLHVAGVEDRDGAEKLRGQYISVALGEVHPLPEDTFYTFQLVGLAAEDPDGRPLGQVVAVEPGPANDLLVLALPDGRQARVPMVRAFVEVDLPGQRVVIRPIPGLLEE